MADWKYIMEMRGKLGDHRVANDTDRTVKGDLRTRWGKGEFI